MLARPAARWTPAATLQDVGWHLFSFLMPNSWPASHPSKIKASGGAVEVLPGSCKLRVKYARTNPQICLQAAHTVPYSLELNQYFNK